MPAFACGSGKVQFEDKFDALDPSWNFSAADPSRSTGPAGLSYKMKPGSSVTTLNQSGFYDDYEVCAEVSMQVKPNANGYIGVAFWGVDNNNLYTFDISPIYGQFAVYRAQKGKYLVPVKWTDSPTIKKANGDINEVSVTVKGKHATLMINGTKVAEFNGQPPDGGSLPGIDLSTAQKDPEDSSLTIKSIQVLALP